MTRRKIAVTIMHTNVAGARHLSGKTEALLVVLALIMLSVQAKLSTSICSETRRVTVDRLVESVLKIRGGTSSKLLEDLVVFRRPHIIRQRGSPEGMVSIPSMGHQQRPGVWKGIPRAQEATMARYKGRTSSP